MHLLAEAMSGLGTVLLPVAVGLLFEELTFGGLVRLMLAPLPGTGKRRVPSDRSSSMGSKGNERSNQKGEGQ